MIPCKNYAVFSVFWALRFDSLQKLCYIFNILSFVVWLLAIIWVFWFKVWLLAKIMLYFQYFELWGLTPCKIYDPDNLIQIIWSRQFDPDNLIQTIWSRQFDPDNLIQLFWISRSTWNDFTFHRFDSLQNDLNILTDGVIPCKIIWTFRFKVPREFDPCNLIQMIWSR